MGKNEKRKNKGSLERRSRDMGEWKKGLKTS
jgi:hypothetical protein